jgi:flagellar basal-body rod protein FlgB
MSGMDFLERFLTLTAQRNNVVVTNMANIDTPGYRTRDVDFRSELRRVANSSLDPTLSPVGREVSGLIERPDGNNVSLDREGMALAETQMQYRVAVQLIRSEFHRLLTAINEGK